MKKYQIAIFDLDGTLMDTGIGVLSSVRHVIKIKDLPELSEEQIQSFVGPPVQVSFQNVYGMSKENAWECADIFREQYKNVDLLKADAYPGIYDCLQTLRDKGIKIAVATYKRHDYAMKLLNYYNFNQYFDIMYGADMEGKYTKKDIICKCMDDLGITDYHSALMIGDTSNDAKGAMEIGMDFMGVTYGYGYRTEEDMNEYPYVAAVDRVEDIVKYF